MTENEIAREIVDAALKIHRVLGPGLLESVYERILAHELRKRLHVIRQMPVALVWEGIEFDVGFRADMLVERKVLVELKSVSRVSPADHRAALTYVRLAGMRLGLLLNFGAALMKDGITRLANNLPEGEAASLSS